MKIRTLLNKKYDPDKTGYYDLDSSQITAIQIIEVSPLQRVVKFKSKSLKLTTEALNVPKAAELHFPYMQFGIVTKLDRRQQEATSIYLTGTDEPFDGDLNKIKVVPTPNSLPQGWICLGENYNPKSVLHVINDFLSRDFVFFEVSGEFSESAKFINQWIADKKMPDVRPNTKQIGIYSKSVAYYVLWAESLGKTLD
jgi:hypothetical protein